MKIPKLKFKPSKLWLGIGIVVIIIILIAIFGRSKTSSSLSGTITNDLPNFPATKAEDISALKNRVDKTLTYDIVASNPDSYKGKVVQWGGRVFVEPEKDDKAVYLQIMHTSSDKSFIVGYKDPNFQTKVDDYLLVTGVVKGKFDGKNGFGANLSVPILEAGFVEKSTRSGTAEAANKTITVNQTNSQHNFNVTLEKIELTGTETRFFVSVKNDSKQKVSFYTYDVKAMQGSKQYEAKSVYNSAEELPSEFLPGAEAKGVLVSDAIDKTQKDVTLFLDHPSGGDYSQDWQDISFKVNIQ